MKKTVLSLAIVAFFALNACEQTAKNVPAESKKAFAEKFPGVEKVKWDRESDTEWEAEFKMDGNKMSAVFDSNGNWLETETETAKKDIPEAVSATLSREFGDYDIEEVEFIENSEYKGFEIMLEKDEADISLVIDEQGNIIKKEVKEEKDEDEDDDHGKHEREGEKHFCTEKAFTDDSISVPILFPPQGVTTTSSLNLGTNWYLKARTVMIPKGLK